MTSRTPKALRTILTTCLALQQQERLVIVAHESLSDLGEALWSTAKRITKQLVLLKYARQKKNGTLLPGGILSLMKSFAAGVVVTPDFLDERTFDLVRQDGCRIVVLQNASAAMLERTLTGNFNKVSMRSRRLADLFSIGKKMQVVSPSGTDVQIAITKLKGIAQTGLANNAGELTSIPAGEAYLLLNQNIEGRLSLDRIAGNRKKLSQNIVLNVQRGRIAQIKGKKDAELLRKSIRKFGSNGRIVHKFGIGTNKNVTLGNSAQEDEKASGTIHISFGENRTTKSQGKMLQSIKGLILNPTLSIDGKLIIKDGEYQV